MSIEDILKEKNNEEIYLELKLKKPSINLVSFMIENGNGNHLNELTYNSEIDQEIKINR